MKPAPFDYVAATTVDETIEALNSIEDASVLAGGQSLVPLMNLRLARPSVVVDINGVHDLDGVHVNGSLRVGALCRHRRLELDPQVATAAPLVAEAASLVGHPSVRNRGTIGGSLAHGDPVAELAATLLALEGSVIVRGPTGSRRIEAADLHEGWFATTLAPGELLIEVELPLHQPGEGSAIREYAPRHGDFAVVGIIVVVVRREDSTCTRARAAGCGLGSTPVDLSGALSGLIGASTLSDDALRGATSDLIDLIDPHDDVHGSAAFRKDLAQVLLVDAVRAAWGRAVREGER